MVGRRLFPRNLTPRIDRTSRDFGCSLANDVEIETHATVDRRVDSNRRWDARVFERSDEVDGEGVSETRGGFYGAGVSRTNHVFDWPESV